MFITRSSQAELPLFAWLRAVPGARVWRSVGIATQQPFFLSTLQRNEAGDSILESDCIVWDTDLIQHIQETDALLVDLLYLAPPWCTETNGWTARSIASVWMGTFKGAKMPVFLDIHGTEFCADLAEVAIGDIRGRHLIAEVKQKLTNL